VTTSNAILLVLLAILALSGPFVAGTMLLWRRKRARARKRSPLTTDLLRPPGYSLRLQIEALRDKVDEALLLLVAAPLALYSAHVTQSHFMSAPESTSRTVVEIVAGVVAIGWISARLLRLSIRLDHMRIAIDAEMFVGQELDQLMRNGAVVFHDVPADKFNIDHIVVARSGVFAVETKGRAKPIRGQGSKDATVIFDGGALHFPGWSEAEPVAQANRQAKWTAEWLTRAVGAQVDATPVLVVPGWWIDRRCQDRVLIYNGKKPQFLLTMGAAVLSEEMIQRISHQVDQRCRSVKPMYSTVGVAPSHSP
jgi:hypothetical protein